MPPETPATDPSTHGFPATRWSLVLGSQGQRGRAALNELCVRYWFPAYAYLRHLGHAPRRAQRLAAAFFDRLSTADFSREDVTPRFRDWLRARLAEFVAATGNSEPPEVPPLAGAPDVATLEHQLQYASYTDSPERLFEASFAEGVLAHGLQQLRKEAAEAGRSELFELLAPYVSREPGPDEAASLAQRSGLRPATLSMALKRLRSRFRELVEDELMQTMGDAGTLRAERAALLAALERRR